MSDVARSAIAKSHAGAVWRISERHFKEDVLELQGRVLGYMTIFGHVARLPTVIPASAAFSIASTATDGVSPMPDRRKRSRGRPPNTWLIV